MASSFNNAIDLSDESSATGSDHVTNRLERDYASDTQSRDARQHSRGLTLNDVRIKIRRTFQSDDTGEPLSPLKAKVVASIVMIFCGFFVGFAAYREAILASRIKDPWMRQLRMRNSYVISAAGVFLGICLWGVTIWILDSYRNG